MYAQFRGVTRRSFMCGTAAAFAIPVMGWGRPAVSVSPELTFFALGDWGDGGSSGQYEVAAGMRLWARNAPPRFVISLGDNFYSKGVRSVGDPKWKGTFESIYTDPALMCPWYVVLGNHDYLGNVDAQINYSKIDPRWHMPARYYQTSEALSDGSFADFFFLDTTAIVGGRKHSAGDAEQFDWLERGLAGSTANWKIVVGHHPVYSTGKHGDDGLLISELKPMFDRFGVSAYCNGHDHSLQHIVVDNVQYLTSGAGSQSRPSFLEDGSLFASSELGFMAVTIRPKALGITFIDAAGEPIYDAQVPVRA